MQTLFQDIRYALRQARQSPGFMLTAIITLTLAIGANVVVFGVVNALLLHPLPVKNAQRLYQIQGRKAQAIAISYPNYKDIRDWNRTFSNVAIYRLQRIGLDATGVAQPVWGYGVTGNYFPMLGVKPLLGRFLTPADDAHENGSQVAVLSYAAWKVWLGGDPHVVGRTVRLNKIPYTVIGVAPKNFSGTEKDLWPELWTPIQNEPQIEGYNWLNNRGDSNAWVVGRLKDGVTPQQAGADLHRVAEQLAHTYPKSDKSMTLRLAKPGMLGDLLGGPVHAFLLGVMLLAGLVLLAACANLGALFAARTADRAREIAIRIAIGSSRRRIFRQLLTESVMMSVIAGVAASFVALLLLTALTQWHPQSGLPSHFLLEPDRIVYFFAMLISLTTGVIFGAIPARQIWTTDPNQAIKSAGAAIGRASRFALRDVLLAVQIALCCLLVTASFVALRGLQRTFTMPLGIEPHGVVVATMDLTAAHYTGQQSPGVQQRLVDEVSRIPGVTAAAYSSSTPLSVDQSNTEVFAPGTTDFSVANAKFSATYFQVSPGYFHAAGTRLLSGRDFTKHDDSKSPRVAIVNETFARKLFGTVDAVGKHYPGFGGVTEIVGVVEDGKYTTLTEDPRAALFMASLQSPNTDTALIVRSHRSPAEIIPAVRAAIARVDPSIPVFSVSSWPDALDSATFPARAATIALGVLGGLAIMLAITGIFGLASYSVSKRMRELGIRVALGAQSGDVLRAALGRMLAVLVIGSAAGLILGIAASRVLASIVYQATASDPLVIFGAVASMALIGLLSAALPARRALGVEPAELLREE